MSQMNSLQQPIQVDLSKLKTVVCSCGKLFFEPVQSYKVVPSIYSPTGKPQLVAMNYFRCIECGSVYSPEDILTESSKLVTSN